MDRLLIPPRFHPFDFSLVLPAYNPGPRLEQTWHAVRDFLAGAPGRWEALFVLDGCTDGSDEHLGRLAREAPGPIRVLSHCPNRGKGYAVRRGLEAGRGRWRLFTDVDLAYSFADVLRVAEVLRGGAEVAIASRAHPDSRLTLSPALCAYVLRRHVQSVVFGRIVRRLLPLTHPDTQAGLKGLTAAAVRQVVPRLRCDGFGFDCELLTACVRLGLPVTEVPVSVQYLDRASTTGGRAIVRLVRDLWAIRRRWRRVPPAPKALNVPEVPEAPGFHALTRRAA